MTGVTPIRPARNNQGSADEVPKKVRASFYKSEAPGQWVRELIERYNIDEDKAEVFACGWFAGKYAGVSEVFYVVQKEMETMEKDRVEKKEMESKYQGLDGYV